MGEHSTIQLKEFKPCRKDASQITGMEGEQLWRKYGKYLNVEFPSPKTGDQWVLTPQGYAGHIKLDDLELAIHPKVDLNNLFEMLEYAYKVKLNFGSEEVQLESILDLFERLATILSKRIIHRSKQGLYQSYIRQERRLGFVRGRIDLTKQLRQAWSPAVHCKFDNRTADLEDNQILLCALLAVRRTGLCGTKSLPFVRNAIKELSAVSEKAFSSQDCVGRTYNRLNQNYEPMHSLCRFFLDNTGPTHRTGNRNILPFLVKMDRVYESFVAQWLLINPSTEWRFRPHVTRSYGTTNKVGMDIDLALYDRASGKCEAALDTKYKTPVSPANSDIYQVIAYAEAMGCRSAFLVYPEPLPSPLDITVGAIHVRSIQFGVSGSLDANGGSFVSQLNSMLSTSESSH